MIYCYEKRMSNGYHLEIFRLWTSARDFDTYGNVFDSDGANK